MFYMFGAASFLAAGLQNLQKTIIDSWIGPAFIIILAVLGLMMAWGRKWRELAVTVAIAAGAGVLIFAGAEVFGNKDGGLTKTAKDAVGQVNVVSAPSGVLLL